MAGLESRGGRGRAREEVPFCGPPSPEECGKAAGGPEPAGARSLLQPAAPASFTNSPSLRCPQAWGASPSPAPRVSSSLGSGHVSLALGGEARFPRPGTIPGFSLPNSSLGARARLPEGGFALRSKERGQGRGVAVRMGRGSQDRGGSLLQPRPVSARPRGRRSASARGQGLSPKPAGSRTVPGLRRQPPHNEL